MTTVYLNSKNEEVEIAKMAMPHLLYSIAKNAKYVGLNSQVGNTVDPSGCARKEEENRGMHAEVLDRYAKAKEAAE